MNSVPDDVIDCLSGVTPFDTLGDDALKRVASRLTIRYFRSGEGIIDVTRAGGSGLHIVRKGAVELLDDGGRVLEQRGEGELFGHRIAFDPPVDRYGARAAEDSLVWTLEPSRADTLLKNHARFAQFLDQRPGERLAASAERAHRSLADLGLARAVTTGPERSIGDCARLMAQHRISCLPVVEGEHISGIVTDRDLRNRVLARDLSGETPVRDVMTAAPSTVNVSAAPHDALVEMMRLGVHHLPVVDAAGRLQSVISSGDLMQTRTPDPLRLVRTIQRADTVEDVAEAARQAPATLASLAESGASVTGIGRMAGRITDACTIRLIELARADLGEAPMRWTWLAFGSQARMEQGLVSDQDNGLLLAETPDAEADAYFRRLAETVCAGLDACGYVFCPGGVMAKGEWRMSLEQWRKRFDRWMREPEPGSVMHCSIFFDMRAVHGDAALAAALQEAVLEQASDSDIFRRFLAAESMSHRPPLGLFRQFVQERDGKHSKGLNLKKRGVIPVVDLARVHALEGALPQVHTEERLAAAAGAGLMTSRDADDLVHALRFIATVRLEHQAGQLRAGRRPDHLVDPGELSGLHRRYLRSAFGIVNSAQRAMSQHYLL